MRKSWKLTALLLQLLRLTLRFFFFFLFLFYFFLISFDPFFQTFTFLLLGDRNAGKSTFLNGFLSFLSSFPLFLTLTFLAFSYSHDRGFLELISSLPLLSRFSASSLYPSFSLFSPLQQFFFKCSVFVRKFFYFSYG